MTDQQISSPPPSRSRSTLTILLTAVILVVMILGAFGVVDTVALDDALEPVLGVRIFMTDPLPTATQALQATSQGGGGAGTPGGDWWQVYFTTPGVEQNRVAFELIQLIGQAQRSIHIASFEFNLDEVALALIAAHQRGVEVEWVTDDEYGMAADEEDDHGQFAMLEKAGIRVKDDQRGALMHNKFWIFDGEIVWTGSTNITMNDTLKNNNNVIVIDSPVVAAIYEGEFQEMWADGAFGPTSPSTVDQQQTVIDGTPVTVLFASEDEVATFLAELLASAKTEIRFMAFSFTHDDMGGSIVARAQDGVDVAGIFEQRGSETEYSEMIPMFCAGLPVRQDGNPQTFHHKVLVIDKHIVVTGSFNFSEGADSSNDENAIILDNAEIAALYLKEFERRWAEAQAPDPADFSCP